jgi:hypothetical protein
MVRSRFLAEMHVVRNTTHSKSTLTSDVWSGAISSNNKSRKKQYEIKKRQKERMKKTKGRVYSKHNTYLRNAIFCVRHWH